MTDTARDITTRGGIVISVHGEICQSHAHSINDTGPGLIFLTKLLDSDLGPGPVTFLADQEPAVHAAVTTKRNQSWKH